MFISFDWSVTLQCIATCVNFWIFRLVSGMKSAALERDCFHTGAPPTLFPQRVKSCCFGRFTEGNRVIITVCLAYFLDFDFCSMIFHGTLQASMFP